MADVKTEVTLKLVVIIGRNEVLFVEAGKDFVDALFSFLKLPLRTVARLVLKEPNVQPIEVASLSSLYQRGMLHLTEGCSSLGSVEGLYKSVVDFEEVIGLQRNISETANSKGYVKGPIMYMATDDLVVTLMSSISVISLLSSVCIHVNDLEEKVGVLILQASLTSTSVLSVGLGHLLTPR
ncbi:hypothetical protein JHK87_018440 [Glycine soja]|nr:hypothetical protein JHK87_018434 [Glycine soja]KAG5009925.1 hypothetical protein JHK87_018440 [Glycine soja]